MCGGSYRSKAEPLFQATGCLGLPSPTLPPEPPPGPLPIRWDCDTATGVCTPSATGQYATIGECESACKESPTCPPPTIACPAPQVNVTCPSGENGKPKETLFSVWQERDSKVCVITRDDESPGAGSWNLLVSGQDLSSAAGITRTQCPPTKPRPAPDATIVGNPLAFLAGPNGCSIAGTTQSLFQSATKELWQFLFGLKDSKGGATIWQNIVKGIIGGLPFGDLLAGTFGEALAQIDGITQNVISQAVGSAKLCGGAVFGQGLLNLVNLALAGGGYPLVESNKLAVNFACPHKVPDANAATEAFIRNSMSAHDMDCYVKMDGYDAKVWRSIADGRRSKMSPLEVTALWRRGIIDTVEHTQAIRGLGFTDQDSAPRYRELSLQLPPSTDIVRMMVRDVADTTIPFWPAADKLFQKKYSGKLKEWGEQQGMQDEVMKFLWRAHFILPAPSQLYTFYHRYRHQKDLWPTKDPDTDIRNTLIQQDILPDWIDLYIRTSFRPINRVDTRRAFTIGAMTEKQLAQAYTNQGYDDANVKILVDFTKRLRLQTLSQTPQARSYRDGGLTRAEASAALQTGHIPASDIDDALDRARDLRRAKIRIQCGKAIERRFLLGEIDDKQAKAELVGQGHEPIDADDLVEGFKCKKAARGKTIPATTLCGWVDDGIINGGEMLDRLLNLGYDVNDASNLVKQCNLRVSRKKRAAAVRASKDAVRLAKQAESSRRQRLKAQDRRLQELGRAAEYLAKGEGMILPDALARVNALFAALQFAFAATMDEAIQAVLAGAKQTGFDTETLFEFAASRVLQERRVVAARPLQTVAEVAAEVSAHRVLQCVTCFHQMQASESTQPLQQMCPVCGQPMTVLEVISQLGGNGEARI